MSYKLSFSVYTCVRGIIIDENEAQNWIEINSRKMVLRGDMGSCGKMEEA